MLRRILVLVGLASLCLSCLAQVGPQESCLEGNVSDTSGTAIDKAEIAVQEVGTAAVHAVVADSEGHFELCGLVAGQYRITAHHTLFADSTQEESLSGVGTETITFDLKKNEPLKLKLDNLQNRAEQEDEGSHLEGIGSVKEFRLGADFTGEQSIPDAPSFSKQHTLHGQLYGFLGSNLAEAPDVTNGMQLPAGQFGAAFGGNIGHGQTSFFVSYDQYGINRQRLLSNLAGQVGVGNTGLLADANVLISSAFVARADHQFSQRDSGYLQYNRDEMRGNSLQFAKDAPLPSGTTGLNITAQNIAAGNTVNLSGTTVNETRAQFIATDAQLPAGAEAIGLQSMLPTERRNHVFMAADNIYRQVGSQSLRTGGDFLYNQMSISFLQASMGRISTTGPSVRESTQDAGLYVQSARQFRPNLLVTTGIRYDLQGMRGMRTDPNNISPQVGFAWSPGSSRTVLRAGFGISYDRIPLPIFIGSSDPSAPANLSRSTVISNLGTAALGDYANFQTVAPTIQNSYAEHATLEAEQQIGGRSVLSAEYQFVRGVQLALPVERTAALCASTSACAAGRTFTGQQLGTGAVSSYNGFSIAFTQQPIRWGNYKVSYTYSTAEGEGTGVNESYVNDGMRRLSFTGVLHTSLDPGSTMWQRLTHGFLLSGTTDYLSRSEFLGMNFINLNARLTKSLVAGPQFRLEGLVETFNALQRTNSSFSQAVTEMGESRNEIFSTYQRVAAVQSPNGTQAGFRLIF